MQYLMTSEELYENSITYLKELIKDIISILISRFDGPPSKLIINSDLKHTPFTNNLISEVRWYNRLIVVSYEEFNGILKLE